MAPTTESALPLRLQDVSQSLVGRKVRLAGRLLSYDTESGNIVISHKSHAIIVNTALCLDSCESMWIREEFCPLEVLGTVEVPENSISIPDIPRHVIITNREEGVFVSALLISARPGLDLDLYNSGIDAVREVFDP